MTAQWLEQRRIGETLRVLVEDGKAMEIHLHRDADPLPLGWSGEAIVRDKVGGRLRVEVDGQNAWLIGSSSLPFGTRVPVRVIREPIAEPGQVKPAHVIEQRGLALHETPPPARRVDEFDASLEIDEWLDRAVSGDVPFSGGALSLERTRAGLVIDVDGSGDAVALNEACAAAIGQMLQLFQVGGMVMIDFISLESKQARSRIDAALELALKDDPRPAERTAMNGFGMVQIVRARRSPSLIDRLCGTKRAGLSLHSEAHALLWATARSKGSGARTLTARQGIIHFLEANPALLDELRTRLGADVLLVRDEAAPGHGHVHVRPV